VTALHPSALYAPTAADLDELAAIFAEHQPEVIDAIDREAAESTRDDGELYHGRLPSDDCDEFNPWIVARASLPREVQS